MFGGSVEWAVSWMSLCVFCDVFVASHFDFSVGQYRLPRFLGGEAMVSYNRGILCRVVGF